MTKEYGNIKIRLKTGFSYEEINKIDMLGALARKLSLSVSYNAPVFIDLNHHYTGECTPAYFISYDKASNMNENYLKKDQIVIRQVARRFDPELTLKLLEYSINNISLIKASQKKITYGYNYCSWEINSLDTTLIKSELKRSSSALIKSTLEQRIDRPEKNMKEGISYYTRNNKYFLFYKCKNRPDSIIARYNEIYQFKTFGNCAIVFNTDSSFYFVDTKNKTNLFKKHIIKNSHTHYHPFGLEKVNDKIIISYVIWNKRTLADDTAIYYISTGILK